MALHEQSVGATSEWYTPPYVFEAMDTVFDLDVASPGSHIVPWIPASACFTDSALERRWDGFVWMNAPFGARNGLIPWLDRFVEHRNGVCLVPDRTSAPWWQRYTPLMEYILFVSPKIRFLDANGNPGNSPAQGTCLMSIGAMGMSALLNAAHNTLGIIMTPTPFTERRSL